MHRVIISLGVSALVALGANRLNTHYQTYQQQHRPAPTVSLATYHTVQAALAASQTQYKALQAAHAATCSQFTKAKPKGC